MSDLHACEQGAGGEQRYLNPSDINVPFGYTIEVFAHGLDSPASMIFTENGELIVAESGITSGKPRVLKLVNNEFVTIAENFEVPITGVNYKDGYLYVSHRGYISRIDQKGLRQILISGLPSTGDYYNNNVVFGSDNKLYFGQGTATNSGVVGEDNTWVMNNPLTCDYPGDYIMLYGQNFITKNITNEVAPGETIITGAFSPYGIPNVPFELRKGFIKASGSILRANLDGTKLELYAWGFRNPAYIGFDGDHNLYAANDGYDAIGSRPIANAPDEFFAVTPGLWHGWPDYSGGDPVTLPRFTPASGIQPKFLIKNHPNDPPKPFTDFPPNSGIRGFDFNHNKKFGPEGDIYIAEFGSGGGKISQAEVSPSYSYVGHRVSKIDINTGVISTFAINKSGFPASISQEGGLDRPTDVVFGPDGNMYILDLGLSERYNYNSILPNTGVIWRVYKS